MGRGIIFGISVAISLASLYQSEPAPAPSVTFNRDVAPVLYAHCTGCHRPGQIAPMSLLTYEEARPWAKSIKRAVTMRIMPPWFADRHIGTFLNDPSLSDHDVDQIARWVDGGALQGDPADLPPPPRYPEGWRIGTPDLILTVASPFALPAEGIIDYQYFELPTHLTGDRWVQAVEIRPSDPRVVHHALAFSRGPAAAPAPTAGLAGRKICSGEVCGDIERHDPRFGHLLAASAVGTQPDAYPRGTAKLLQAGSVVTLQVHYTTMGTPTTDRISVGLIFAKARPTVELMTAPLAQEVLVIPPRAPNHVVEAKLQFQKDSALWSLGPHNHLRGKSWRYDLIEPDGRTRTILAVPHFDFHWQLNYVFKQPIEVTQGSWLHAVAVFDNSALNRHNPDPDAEVRWGDQTKDEMMFTSVVYSLKPRPPGLRIPRSQRRH